MKKFILCIFTVCLIFLSGCSFFQMETPMSKEDAQKAALTCFKDHKTDMEAIIQSDKAMGETKWCKVYNLLSNGEYEFVLQQTGFTGTNTKTGVLYIYPTTHLIVHIYKMKITPICIFMNQVTPINII